MKKHLIALLSLFSLLFIQLSWANNTPPKPRACPAIKNIISGGLLEADTDDEDSMYVVGQINNYKTPQTWAFMIGVSYNQATSKDDAYAKANAALNTLSGSPSPSLIRDADTGNYVWYCLYNINQYVAIAAEPFSMSHGVKGFTRNRVAQ